MRRRPARRGRSGHGNGRVFRPPLRGRVGERGRRSRKEPALRVRNRRTGAPAAMRSLACFSIAASTRSNASRSWFLNRRTWNPSDSNFAWRTASYSTRPSWLIPSSSTMSMAGRHRKSAMQGPMTCCRWNLSPPNRFARKHCQRILSDSVEPGRRARALARMSGRDGHRSPFLPSP
jgi:hypothetical protein